MKATYQTHQTSNQTHQTPPTQKKKKLTVAEHACSPIFDARSRVGRAQLVVFAAASQCFFGPLQKHTGGKATGECMNTGCQHGLVTGIELCTRELCIRPPCPRSISKPGEVPRNTRGRDFSMSAAATTGRSQSGFMQGKSGSMQWTLFGKDQIGHVWVVQ